MASRLDISHKKLFRSVSAIDHRAAPADPSCRLIACLVQSTHLAMMARYSTLRKSAFDTDAPGPTGADSSCFRNMMLMYGYIPLTARNLTVSQWWCTVKLFWSRMDILVYVSPYTRGRIRSRKYLV